MNTSDSFETVLEYVIEVLKNLVGATSAGLLLYDQAEKRLVLQKPAFGVFDQNVINLYQVSVEDGGNAVNVFKTKNSYRSNNVQDDPIIIQRLAKTFNISNIVTVPVSTTDECYGVFHVINKSSGFTEEDVSLIKLLVSQIAAALRSAWQLNEIKNQELEARALLRLSNRWTLGSSSEMLNHTINEIYSVVRETDIIAIGLEGKTRLVFGESRPEKTEQVIKGVDFWSKLAKSSFSSSPNTKILSPDADLNEVEKWAQRHGYLACIGVPIQSKSKLWGMIWAWRKQEHSFETRQIRFLSLVAAQLAMVLHNCSLFKKEKNTANKLRRLFNLHDCLSKVLTEETGVEGITHQLAEYLGLPVVFSNKTGNKRVVMPLDDFYANQFDLSCEVRKYIESNKPDANARGPVQVIAQIGGMSLSAILAPIKSSTEILGFLGVLEKGRSLDKLDLFALDKAITYYVLELMKSKISFEVEQNLKVDFINSLIKGELSSPVEVSQRAASFGLDPTVKCRIVVFEIDFLLGPNCDRSDDKEMFRFKRRLLKEVMNYLDVYKQTATAMNMGNRIIVIVPGTGQKSCVEAIDRKLAEDIAMLLKTRYKLVVSTGLSTPTNNIMDFAKAFQEAEMSVDYLKKTGKQGQIMFYRDMGIYKLLINFDTGMTQEFVNDLLGGLLTVEEDKKNELLKTLEVYLDNECNMKNSATILHIHPNTLRYRISQIEDLTSLNLVSSSDRANAHLAIRLMNLVV
jgi:sugar diacid utilization regulator/GAF domain-containing protein